MNILFVCTMNKWRSPTAKKVYNSLNKIKTRSAGTSPKARRTISANDIRWADIICVMESKHRSRIKTTFPNALNNKQIHVLEIEDNYQFMDPELIELLIQTIDPILETLTEPY